MIPSRAQLFAGLSAVGDNLNAISVVVYASLSPSRMNTSSSAMSMLTRCLDMGRLLYGGGGMPGKRMAIHTLALLAIYA